jgi:hypothetical protein
VCTWLTHRAKANKGKVMNTYDFTKFQFEDVKRVLLNNGFIIHRKWDLERIKAEAQELISCGKIDEIEFIIEESGL